MTAGWCARTVRSAVFAAVCVLLAAVGHVLMSGSPVPAWALAAGTAVTTALGWTLSARERGLALVASAAVGAQTALHCGFSAAQVWTTSTTSMGSMHMDMAGDMSAMHMGSAHISPAEYLVLGTGGTASTGMLAAHLLAALLCGLWLGHGERAAFRISRAAAARLTAPLIAPLRLLLALPVAPGRPRPRPHRRRSDRAPRLLLLVHAITSRGPPVRTAVI
ncbi:hypothetical protein [Streptomyces sp. NPDC048282]|uniref:hypothetical protein n=1 Tax=Streptomyces sp. NPDC048282 TaxID=3365528 RepID=UPI003712C5C0